MLLAAGNDVDVDAGRTRLMDNTPQDRPGGIWARWYLIWY
jgi:hypothetical protein